MDRPRRRPLLLIIAALAAGPSGAQTLRAQRWLAPGADASTILSRRPVECLRTPGRAAPGEAYLIEVGRAAFRDPLLLGGQAARAGVACETCHRNGRTNRDFAFPGVSGAPGTADVTSFVFSSHRGDRLADPRPIPDLGGPKAALKVSQAPDSPALRAFIRGLVTEEFDGHPPPDAVLDGLAAYVRALQPADCDLEAVEPVTVVAAFADVDRAVAAAREALALGDRETASAMIRSARGALGDIAERFAGPRLSNARADVTRASRALGEVLPDDREAPASALRRLDAWTRHFSRWRSAVVRAEPFSLYEPRRLAAALALSRSVAVTPPRAAPSARAGGG